MEPLVYCGMRLFVPCALALVNEIFRKPTVRHRSTIFFPRTKIFTPQFSCELDSEPEAAPLSSVKNVTATSTVQLALNFFPKNKMPMWGQPPSAVHRAKLDFLFSSTPDTPPLCPTAAPSFILTNCPNTVDRIRSSYLSCPSVHSNLTGAGEARSMVFARA
jgi:hypothetical protein